MVKKIFSVSLFVMFGGFLGTIMILAGNKSQREDSVSLNELSYYKGRLDNLFLGYKRSTSGLRLKYKFVAMKIQGLHQLMAVYHSNQIYTDILDNIDIGDTVSLYFREHSDKYEYFTTGQNFNSDIYELSVNNKEYLNIRSVKAGRSSSNIVAIILGIFIYILVTLIAIFQLRKSD